MKSVNVMGPDFASDSSLEFVALPLQISSYAVSQVKKETEVGEDDNDALEVIVEV